MYPLNNSLSMENFVVVHFDYCFFQESIIPHRLLLLPEMSMATVNGPRIEHLRLLWLAYSVGEALLLFPFVILLPFLLFLRRYSVNSKALLITIHSQTHTYTFVTLEDFVQLKPDRGIAVLTFTILHSSLNIASAGSNVSFRQRQPDCLSKLK